MGPDTWLVFYNCPEAGVQMWARTEGSLTGTAYRPSYVASSHDVHTILFIEGIGDILGGGQVSLLGLLTHLDRSLFYPIVLCPSKGSFVEELHRKRIETIVMNIEPLKVPHLPSVFLTILDVYRLVRDRGIRIIHSNAAASKETFYAALAAKLAGVPFVWHVRVVEQGGWRDGLLAVLSTRIIAISEAVAAKFQWAWARSKITVVWNGVELDRYDPTCSGNTIRREYGIPRDAPLVGIVGQLIPCKGHRFFIEAADMVRRQFVEARFMVVGRDMDPHRSYEAELKELSGALNLHDRLIFTGYREDIPQIMAAMDVFVLSSIMEPFGRVVLEAMAMAKPVVATRAGGVPEIVINGETGLLVPPENPQAMAQAIVQLLRDRGQAARMGRAGRERVERYFGMEAHVAKIAEIYEELLDNC